MTDPIIRLAPSGKPISNAAGAGFAPGPGARLRLAETNSTMTGSLAIPVDPTTGALCPDGFGQTDAIVLELDGPKQGLGYRAKLSLDIANSSTNVEGEVVLYIDLSVDGGTTYTNRAKNVHLINGTTTGANAARSCELNLILSSGSFLGVSDAVPTPSIKMRARASLPLGTAGAVTVSSLAASDGGTPVTGLVGTLHMELEECF